MPKALVGAASGTACRNIEHFSLGPNHGRELDALAFSAIVADT